MNIKQHLKRAIISIRKNSIKLELGGGYELTGLPGDAVVRQIYIYGNRFTELPMATIMLSMTKGKRIADIGAHFGYYSLMFRAWGALMVDAYEPMPIQYIYLKGNTLKYSNINAINVAAGTTNGSAIMIYTDDLGGCHITGPKENTFDKPTALVKVETIKKKYDLVKIDAEGYELKIIQGMKYKPKHLFIEMIDENIERQGLRKADIIDYLKDYGYTGYRAKAELKQRVLRASYWERLGLEPYAGQDEYLVYWTKQ